MCKANNIDITFSESEIKKYQKNSDVKQLKDPRYPLKLRFSADRTKASWHLVTYRNNKGYWRKVGTWPLLTAKALIKKLPELMAQIAINPDNTKLRTEDFHTVGDLLAWYQIRCGLLKGLSKHRKASIKSVIKCHLYPTIGQIPYLDLTASQVDDLLICPLQSTHALSTLNLSFKVLKAAFNQARKLDRIEINPMDPMVFSDFIQTTISAKDGKIKPQMLGDILVRLAYEPIRVQMLICLMLAYATRLGETRMSAWTQFDFHRKTWEIPKEHTKTKSMHELPLTDRMIDLLRAFRTEQKNHGYQGSLLFPGKSPRKPISESTTWNLVRAFSKGDFTAHDFRKVARSIWAEIKIDYMVGERLLNHKLGKLDEAYFQTLISQPKRDAIESYHRYLDNLGFINFHSKTIPRSFQISKQLKVIHNKD